MSDRWTAQARELAKRLGRDYPDVVHGIAAAIRSREDKP